MPAKRLNTNYFLLFLCGLLPDARGNIQLAIAEEYERLLPTARSHRPPSQHPRGMNNLKISRKLSSLKSTPPAVPP